MLVYPAMPAELSRQELLRAQRRRRLLVQRRRRRLFGLLSLLVLAGSAFAVMLLAHGSNATVASGNLLIAENSSSSSPVDATGEAHPVFSKLLDGNLVLPVQAQDATIIAYDSLSDDRAVNLTPMGRQVNGSVVSRSISRVFASSSGIKYYKLRNNGRVVADTGAVDIGAAAGTIITSPVKGTVTSVKQYKLYGKYDDVEVDISPAGMSGVTITMLLVDQPAVVIGQSLVEGKTQIGKVRAAPPELAARLSAYTHDSGSHVHLQVTQEPSQ
jgi:hypothetical protein